MIRRWDARMDTRLADHDKWEQKRRDHFVNRVRRDERLCDEAAGPPPKRKDWQWEGFTVLGDSDKVEYIHGWCPPDLLSEREPDIDLPLPLPDRPLTIEEKHTRSWPPSVTTIARRPNRSTRGRRSGIRASRSPPKASSGPDTWVFAPK